MSKLILSLLIFGSLYSHAIEIDRRSFLKGMAALAVTKTNPSLAAISSPKSLSETFLDSVLSSGFSRTMFVTEAHKLSSVALAEPELRLLLRPQADNFARIAVDVASEFNIPVPQALEELIHAISPQRDYLPETSWGKIFHQPRRFKPLGLDFQDHIFQLLVDRIPEMGTHIVRCSLLVRQNHQNMLPAWFSQMGSRWQLSSQASQLMRSNVLAEGELQVEMPKTFDITATSLKRIREALESLRRQVPCDGYLTHDEPPPDEDQKT